MTKTAFIFDEFFQRHDAPSHPECAARLVSIENELKKYDLFNQMTQISMREITEDEILLCHTDAHLKLIDQLEKKQKKITDQGNYIYEHHDTYINAHTFKASFFAAGSLLALCEQVAKGDFDNGFAFVRPPGHHATRSEVMGFCFLSNIAIAAKSLINNSLVDKIAIIDFDVHHGNGTEDTTMDDDSILFISSHQAGIYPMSGLDITKNIGSAIGTTINCPLPAYTDDQQYLALLERIILPAIERFAPNMILVSAGYDAHWADPLASLQLTAAGFGAISKRLIETADELCHGKIVFNLEGGYHLNALAESVANSVRALLKIDEMVDTLGQGSNTPSSLNLLINELKQVHNL